MSITDTKALICMITGISPDEYNEAQFERAYDYLETVIPGDSWGVTQLTTSPLFWEWWNRQWKSREMQFILNDGLHCLLPSEYSEVAEVVKELWNDLHNGKELTIRPSRFVLEQSFNLMIGELIDTSRKEVAHG